MRSWTSRGVLEWSRGKDLYIGSPVSASGKVSGVTGIVPGPPEGSRGSTGWGHLSRRAPWAEVAWEPAPDGLVRPTQGPKAPRVGNPRGHAPPWLETLRGPLPQGLPPLLDGISRGAAATRGEGLPCPPRQGGTPPLGFPTLGAWGEAQGGRPSPLRDGSLPLSAHGALRDR